MFSLRLKIQVALGWLCSVISIGLHAAVTLDLLRTSPFVTACVLASASLPVLFFGLAIFEMHHIHSRILRSKVDAVKEKLSLATHELEISHERLKRFADALKPFISPSLKTEVLDGQNPQEYAPQKLRKIISFTGMREERRSDASLDLQSAFSVVNRSFEQIMDPVFEQQGEVEKLIGDVVMSTFHEKGARDCLEASLKGRRNLSRLNREFVGRGIRPVKFGTGVAFGDIISANFGNRQKMERSIFGEAVNIASCLEVESGLLGVDILATEAFVRLLGDYPYARPLDRISVRAKGEDVLVYELYGHHRDQVIDFKATTKKALTEVMDLQAAGRWLDCERILRELIKRSPPHTYKSQTIMDPTLQILLKRIQERALKEDEGPLRIVSKAGAF